MSHQGNTLREEQNLENKEDNMQDFVLDIFCKAIPIDRRNTVKDSVMSNIYINAEDLPDSMIHQLMDIADQKFKEKEEKTNAKTS
tara:strand:- start:11444 stop:11698 length:255 start_codon:yes stop_codon:yes gene_type:complete